MRLVITGAAETDLKSIVRHIALDNRAAAQKVHRAIISSTERLLDFPHIGHAGRLPETREYSVTALPYVIVYRVDPDLVTILAVLHAARDVARALMERKTAQ